MVTIMLLLTLVSTSGQTIQPVPLTVSRANALKECESYGRSWQKEVSSNGHIYVAHFECLN